MYLAGFGKHRYCRFVVSGALKCGVKAFTPKVLVFKAVSSSILSNAVL